MPNDVEEDGQNPTLDPSHYDAALAEMYRDEPDIVNAFNLLQQAHALGDIRATYALGTWYIHGKFPVVEQDISKAIQLFEEAAKFDHPEALYDLAVSYEKGETGSQDDAAAFRLYLRAALLGDEQSIFEVGRCYFYGIGVHQDRDVADIWRDRAEKLGISEPDEVQD